MQFLFDSGGRHVANLLKGHLYSPMGENVGHFLDVEKIFIDLSGDYLGEFVHDNRIMYNRGSSFCAVNFGNRGRYANVGNFGSADNCGSIGRVGGFEDVPLERLGQGL